MIKGQNAGNGPIAVDVEKDKSYYWCSCGKSSKQPFCDGSHKGSEFSPLAIKQKKHKRYFFVLVNKLITSLFVMVHITKSNIELYKLLNSL